MHPPRIRRPDDRRFSALQRAEIAEIHIDTVHPLPGRSFSALQRAEIAEIPAGHCGSPGDLYVSVLFNEPKLLKLRRRTPDPLAGAVSVLFNEPKLLKSDTSDCRIEYESRVSVLFNEPKLLKWFCKRGWSIASRKFQCSSTSRNC